MNLGSSCLVSAADVYGVCRGVADAFEVMSECHAGGNARVSHGEGAPLDLLLRLLLRRSDDGP